MGQKSQGKRILLADHDASGGILKTILERHGYFVTCCKSGYETLEQIVGNAFDLAIIDIQIPGINIMNVTRHIKAFGGNLPIIITSCLSSYESEPIMSEIKKTSVTVEEVTKPITNVGGLLEKINRYLPQGKP